MSERSRSSSGRRQSGSSQQGQGKPARRRSPAKRDPGRSTTSRSTRSGAASQRRRPKGAPRMRANASGKSAGRTRVRTAESEAHEAPDIWPWIHLAIGCLLVVPAFITTQAFFDSVLGVAVESAFWTQPRFWWFVWGGLAWGLIFLTLPRPIFLYVLGHELTHYAFVRLSGGQVRSLKVSRTGGYVETDRNNWLISLSPYFVPFYTVLAVLTFGVLALFIDLRGAFQPFWSSAPVPWSAMLLGVVGFTWAFHLTFTVWMISGDQSDLRHYGVFLSLMLIYLANLLLVTALVIVASGNFTWHEYSRAWWSSAGEVTGLVKWMIGR